MQRFSLAELAERIGGAMGGGDGALQITGVQPLAAARQGDITVVHSQSELPALIAAAASAAVVPESLGPVEKPVIRVRAPRLALARLLELFHGRPRVVAGVHPRSFVAEGVLLGRDVNIAAGAHLSPGVQIGDRVDIYPGVFLGEGARVGDDSVIFANVSIYAGTVIGKRARIHSGVVIGSDGFGFIPEPSGKLYKIPQVGNVIIGDDVEIGANTTIDRATMTATRIGDGTKIDNLVQIAHNVQIGDHVCIVAQSGIAGSVRVGDRAMLGAAAGILDHLSIGEEAKVGARAGVTRSVAAHSSVAGTPATELQKAVHAYPLIAHLPELRRRLRELEKRCKSLEAELARGKAATED